MDPGIADISIMPKKLGATNSFCACAVLKIGERMAICLIGAIAVIHFKGLTPTVVEILGLVDSDLPCL